MTDKKEDSKETEAEKAKANEEENSTDRKVAKAEGPLRSPGVRKNG